MSGELFGSLFPDGISENHIIQAVDVKYPDPNGKYWNQIFKDIQSQQHADQVAHMSALANIYVHKIIENYNIPIDPKHISIEMQYFYILYNRTFIPNWNHIFNLLKDKEIGDIFPYFENSKYASKLNEKGAKPTIANYVNAAFIYDIRYKYYLWFNGYIPDSNRSTTHTYFVFLHYYYIYECLVKDNCK